MSAIVESHDLSDGAAPLVSVLICTRNRGESICGTIETILDNDYPRFEVVVIDQSDTDATERSVQPYLADRRLRLVRSDTVGVARAGNIGLSLVNAEIVIITDDDCEVPRNWVSQMARLFNDPRVALAYCDVVAAPHDASAGFVPISRSPRPGLQTSIQDWFAAGGAGGAGIGAGMAIRRSVALELAGFDEGLGPGGRFRSGADIDIALRALLLGYGVFRTDSVAVLHHGFRTWAQGKKLVRNNVYGRFAFYTKLLRCGYTNILWLVWADLLKTCISPFAKQLFRLQRPSGAGRFVAALHGVITAFSAPMERSNAVFHSSLALVEQQESVVSLA